MNKLNRLIIILGSILLFAFGGRSQNISNKRNIKSIEEKKETN